MTLRSYMNTLALEGLPDVSFERIRDAGYTGIQFHEQPTEAQLRECERLGLGRAGSGRVNTPAEVGPLAREAASLGLECVTLHVGWGIEDDDESGRLIEAILQSSRHVPLYVETHRATIFQDMWRTVQFVRRFPELRFNGDYSHWYTGQEMVYGGFDNKVAFIEPVMERVRFMHGRIGNPGCIQVAVSGGETFVQHFRELWTRSFRAAIEAGETQTFLFVPELLASRIYYARELNGREESDRWEQSLVLRRIAEECFTAAAESSSAPASRRA